MGAKSTSQRHVRTQSAQCVASETLTPSRAQAARAEAPKTRERKKTVGFDDLHHERDQLAVVRRKRPVKPVLRRDFQAISLHAHKELLQKGQIQEFDQLRNQRQQFRADPFFVNPLLGQELCQRSKPLGIQHPPQRKCLRSWKKRQRIPMLSALVVGQDKFMHQFGFRPVWASASSMTKETSDTVFPKVGIPSFTKAPCWETILSPVAGCSKRKFSADNCVPSRIATRCAAHSAHRYS